MTTDDELRELSRWMKLEINSHYKIVGVVTNDALIDLIDELIYLRTGLEAVRHSANLMLCRGMQSRHMQGPRP